MIRCISCFRREIAKSANGRQRGGGQFPPIDIDVSLSNVPEAIMYDRGAAYCVKCAPRWLAPYDNVTILVDEN